MSKTQISSMLNSSLILEQKEDFDDTAPEEHLSSLKSREFTIDTIKPEIGCLIVVTLCIAGFILLFLLNWMLLKMKDETRERRRLNEN